MIDNDKNAIDANASLAEYVQDEDVPGLFQKNNVTELQGPAPAVPAASAEPKMN